MLCSSYTMGMGMWVFIAPKPEGVNAMRLSVHDLYPVDTATIYMYSTI